MKALISISVCLLEASLSQATRWTSLNPGVSSLGLYDGRNARNSQQRGPRYSGYHVPVSQNQLTDSRLGTRQEKLEGRNFILDKLCELGFGECYPSSTVQYVQPVQVIPVGDPIPAVPAGSHGQDRTFNLFGKKQKPSFPTFPNPFNKFNKPIGKPSYNAPGSKPSYNAPGSRPSYNAPGSKPSYNAPGGGSKPSYNPPSSGYGVALAPPISGSNNPSSDSYGVALAAPLSGSPSSSFRAPSFTTPQSDNSFNSLLSSGQQQNQRPTRDSVRDTQCYCTLLSQCQDRNIVAAHNYSELIDPRIKDKDIEALALEILKLQHLALQKKGRKKRSPDGVGHHHHHHGHHGNIDLTQTHGSNFGPRGPRPPICGGPGSGYVCCRVSQSNQVDFNELGGGSSVRDVRNQPQQQLGTQFSKFGQCGRRNAHDTQARILNTKHSIESAANDYDYDYTNYLDYLDSGVSASQVVNKLRKARQGGQADSHNSQLQRESTTVDSDFGEYPWQAAILQKDQYDNIYTCGAALIDSNHLLTATHCINKYRPEQLRVRLGEWDVHNDDELYPNLEMDVLDIKYHPNFHTGNLYNDLAIVKMDGLVDFKKHPHISPACLPDAFQDFSGRRCWVSGWGKDAFGSAGSYQNVLKEVDVPVMSQAECQQELRQTRLGQNFLLHPGFLCAGGEEGKDACKGDGGSPLVCDIGGSWQVAGLVSWGIGCGQKNIPGVYVRVGHYSQWIQEMMLSF